MYVIKTNLLSILVVIVALIKRGTSSSGSNSTTLAACPDALATLDCATDDQWLTVQVNGEGGLYVTCPNQHHGDLNCLNGSTKNLSLCDGSVATVGVTIAAGTIRFSTTFIARPCLNGTVLLCFSNADGDKNTTTISIVGPPQTAPTNLTFNSTACTLTWQRISEKEGEEGVSYQCTATFQDGHNITTNVTGGALSVQYPVKDCSVFENVNFTVQAANCAGMGPSANHSTTLNKQLKNDDQGRTLPISKESAMSASIAAVPVVIIGLIIIVATLLIIFCVVKYKRRKPKCCVVHDGGAKNTEADEGGAEDESLEASTDADGDNNEELPVDDTERDGLRRRV